MATATPVRDTQVQGNTPAAAGPSPDFATAGRRDDRDVDSQADDGEAPRASGYRLRNSVYIADDEDERGCSRFLPKLHWRDVFALSNFSVVSLSVAFSIYLSHEGYMHGGEFNYTLVPFAVALGLAACIALAWTTSLVFAHDSLFHGLRTATMVCGFIVSGGGIVVAVATGTRIDQGTPLMQDIKHYILYRLVPITVLIVASQGVAVWGTKGLIADDETTAGSPTRNLEGSMAGDLPDD